MPGTRCAVAVCNNSLFKTKKNPSKLDIRYHSFPKDPLLRKTWVIKCKRNDKFNPETSRICSEHFKDDNFERDMRAELLGHPNRKVLKLNAIPTENLLSISVNAQNPPESERQLRMRKKLQKKVVENLLTQKSVTTCVPGEEIGMKNSEVESTAKQDVQFSELLKPPQPILNAQNPSESDRQLLMRKRLQKKVVKNILAPKSVPTPVPGEEIGMNDIEVESPAEQDVQLCPLLNPPKPSKTIQINQLNAKINFLENKCSNLEKRCSDLQKSRDRVIRQRKEKNKLVNDLKVEIRMKNLVSKRALKELKSLKNEKNKKEQLNSKLADILRSVFSTSQIKILLGNKKVKWSHEDLKKALILRHLSKSAYLLLRKDLRIPLPGLSTLRAYASKLNVNFN